MLSERFFPFPDLWVSIRHGGRHCFPFLGLFICAAGKPVGVEKNGMFGIGFPELIVILVLALIVVGPEKLPDLAKTVAKQLVELKKAAHSLKESLQEETDEKPWEDLERDRPPSWDALPADSENLVPDVQEATESDGNSEDPADPDPEQQGDDD